MTSPSALSDLVASELQDVRTQWSVGTFGAIAEFSREPDEAVKLVCNGDACLAATDKGGVRLACPPSARAFAYETISKTPDHWTQTISLCLPVDDCAMSRRAVLTELGPDLAALREADRDAVLFDLGLGTLQVDVCVRTADPALLQALRAGLDRGVLDVGNPTMAAIVAASPHRVFLTRLGRGEVYQPIPAPTGQSPTGPHTHLLPKLLRAGRTHAATAPIPEGWVPCANIHPEHPARDGFGRPKPFDRTQHDRLQALLGIYGDAALNEIKRRVRQFVVEKRGPEAMEAPTDRHGRAAVRVALRQAKALDIQSAAFDRWCQVYEARADSDDAQDGDAA